MRKKITVIALTAVVVLTLNGCLRKDTYRPDSQPERVTAPVADQEETVETTPAPTVPADGNPEDVTCKGSYTADSVSDAVVATVGEAQLTGEQLQAWYWAAVAQYRQEQHAVHPDYTQPLDTQPCEIDAGVNSWQQYFLRQALSCWHSAQALQLNAQMTPLTTEEAYKPNADTHARCMTGMPATKFLYGYDKVYETNTMHQAFLDSIPEMLDQLAREKGFADSAAMAKAVCGGSAQALEEFAWLYNYSYMYLTFLGYELSATQEEAESWFAQREASYEAMGITRDSGNYVDIRHILLTPGAEGDWDACEQEAQTLLTEWKNKTKKTEASFSELAYRNSQDAGTAASGGAYHQLRQGQLMEELDAWCFDAARLPGDTTVIRTEQGVHILYFSGSTPVWLTQAEKDVAANMQTTLITAAKVQFPMEADYSAITLAQGDSVLSFGDVLYPDIAHERYPEVPLYLQQDYPNTWFGNYKIATHGCGITTFSMLATYMSDEEWTPPEMCALYGNYSFENGTDGMIFINESPKYNFFFREKTYDPNVAKQALMEGHIVVSIQHKGYWTSGGHYILFEKWTEDEMVQVRDSNIANYLKLKQHKEDKHTWFNSTYAGSGYWIFEKKITNTTACWRCGTPEELAAGIVKDAYLCGKCDNALLRRNTWLGSRENNGF